MSIKRLSPGQLYDSLVEASAKRSGVTVAYMRGFDQNQSAFLNALRSSSGDPTEYDAGIPARRR